MGVNSVFRPAPQEQWKLTFFSEIHPMRRDFLRPGIREADRNAGFQLLLFVAVFSFLHEMFQLF